MTAKGSSDEGLVHKRRWQTQLLPLMVWMLVWLTVFFFVSTLVQLMVLHQRIAAGPAVASAQLLRASDCPPTWAADACLALRRHDTAALLEADTVAKRYHQASVLVMSSIWSRYLGFVTGMTLALVGAAFILGQIDAQPSELTGQSAGWNMTLKTASPGLALVVLGSVLMIVSMVTLHEIKTKDDAVYLTGLSAKGDLPAVNLTPAAPPASGATRN